MSFQTAAIVAGVAFLLSFLSGLVGGVPLFDIFLRAFLWALVAFGGCLGAEALLRALVPDLFVVQEPPAPEETSGRSVNITLDEDLPRNGFVEEVSDDPIPEETGTREPPAPAPVRESREPAPVSGPPGEVAGAGTDEEMPEIGSFLDAFKPEAPEAGDGSEAPSSPGYSEYAPVESSRASAGEVTIDGEAQDPVILAKAVQTVMKRDTQGN